MTIVPAALREGDTVGLIAPASPLNNREGVQWATSALRELGLNVVVGAHVFEATGYLAGSDEQRASDVNRFLRSPDVRGIFGLRGGYGTLRLLDALDYDALRADPKIIMGFSDLTTLINALAMRTGVITFHGPILTPTYFTRTMARAFKRLFMKRNNEVRFTWPKASSCVEGVATGRLWGGNLTSFSAMMGTPYWPTPNGAIMLIEDLYELPRRLDRVMIQMQLAGTLRVVSGILAGHFYECRAPKIERDRPWRETLEEILSSLSVPSLRAIEVGHVPGRTQAILPIGASVHLNTRERLLEVIGPVVN